ncbi:MULTISPECIES: SIMPL domain-containing protein [unclassified Sphingomonas]|jgi:uncharacterized protein|nr:MULTISPECIES: SIMPL domain-containing protein [unclassified Sphingomonas]AXJ96164.1 hypothetical protein DM480_12305 [Sphingomonas sp. FARSPH]
MMRSTMGMASGMAAALALLPGMAAAQAVPVQSTALQPGETLLEVQAEGQATYRPDAAFLSVGVVTTGTTAREATDGNAAKMAAVIASLKGAGVEARYIRTQQINVEPRFARVTAGDWQGQAQITGYVARNSVAVTVTRLASAGDVIAAAFGAGANSVSGPNLGSSDPTKGMAEARAAALANAKAEAEGYAAGLGLRVARVLRVSERGNFARPVEYVMTGQLRAPAPPPPPPPPMAPVEGGEMQRSVTVWIDYALAPR